MKIESGTKKYDIYKYDFSWTENFEKKVKERNAFDIMRNESKSIWIDDNKVCLKLTIQGRVMGDGLGGM